MRPSRARSHHPLTAAGSALEHLVLRHFGLQLIQPDSKQSPRRSRRRSDPPTEHHPPSHDDATI
jgi:hypothetical protein